MVTRSKHSSKILAYTAGFVDGEGSIFIAKVFNRRSGNYIYVLQVSIANTYKPIMDWLAKEFNSSTQVCGYANKKRWKDNFRVSYQLLFTGNKANQFLREILPYLSVKQEQAKLAIEFQNKKSLIKRGKKLSEKENIIREKYRQDIKELNLRGTLIGTVRSRND